jgi:ABC-type uncharacterized transport system substrate-binding protein
VTDLLTAKVDVIVAWATPTVVAVRHATSTTPIVMASVGDPVGNRSSSISPSISRLPRRSD